MRMRRSVWMVLGIGLAASACRTRMTGERLPAETPLPRTLVGVPFQLPRPYFTIQRPKKGKDTPQPVHRLDIAYVADSSQRYTINVDPAILSHYNLKLDFGALGNLTGTTSEVKTDAPETVAAIGKFLAEAAIAAGTHGFLDESSAASALVDALRDPALEVADEPAKGRDSTYHKATPEDRVAAERLAARVLAYETDDLVKSRLHYASQTELAVLFGVLRSPTEPPTFESAVSALKAWAPTTAPSDPDADRLTEAVASLVDALKVASSVRAVDEITGGQDAATRAARNLVRATTRLDGSKRSGPVLLSSVAQARRRELTEPVVDAFLAWAKAFQTPAEGKPDGEAWWGAARSLAIVLSKVKAGEAYPFVRLREAFVSARPATAAFEKSGGSTALKLQAEAEAMAGRGNRRGVVPLVEEIVGLSDAEWRYRHSLYLQDEIAAGRRDLVLLPSSDPGRVRILVRIEGLEHDRLVTAGAEDLEPRIRMIRGLLEREPKRFAEYEQARNQLATLEARVSAQVAALKPKGDAAPTTAASGDDAGEDWDPTPYEPLVLELRARPCGVTEKAWLDMEIARARRERRMTEDPEFVVVLERMGAR